MSDRLDAIAARLTKQKLGYVRSVTITDFAPPLPREDDDTWLDDETATPD